MWLSFCVDNAHRYCNFIYALQTTLWSCFILLVNFFLHDVSWRFRCVSLTVFSQTEHFSSLSSWIDLICAVRFFNAVNLLGHESHVCTISLWTAFLCFCNRPFVLNFLSQTSQVLGSMVWVFLCFRRDSLFFKWMLHLHLDLASNLQELHFAIPWWGDQKNVREFLKRWGRYDKTKTFSLSRHVLNNLRETKPGVPYHFCVCT